MIDLNTAKKLVNEWLEGRTLSMGVGLKIVDDRIEEHDWGWVIYWEPVQSPQQDYAHSFSGGLPYLVDKVSGHVLPAGTYGLKLSIARLLQLRTG